MKTAVDLFVLYTIIARLAKPFKETEAFKLGIVDEKGKLLKKPSTQTERAAYNYFDRFIFNLKRLLGKVGLDNKIGAFAVTAWLLREDRHEMSEGQILQEVKSYAKKLEANADLVNNIEEMIVNVTGSSVAGTGDSGIHWGISKSKGRPKTYGKAINAPMYLRRIAKQAARKKELTK